MTSSSPVDGSARGRPMKLDLAHASADERVAPFAAVLDRDEFRRELDRLCRSRWGTPQEARVRPPERLAAAERCGRWLGRLHGPAPRVATAVDPRYRRWADQVASVGEPLARQAADVDNAAAAVLNQVPSKTPSRVPARVADSRAVAFDRAAQGFGVACAVVTVNRRPGCSLRSRQRARLARGASL